MSTDSAWAAPSNPQTANQYAYVINNTYKYTDPSGAIPFFVVTGAIGAAVGGIAAGIASYDPQTGVNWGHVIAGAVGGAIIGGSMGSYTALVVAGSETASVGAVVDVALARAVGAVFGAGGARVAAEDPQLNAVVQNALAPRAPAIVNVSTRGFGHFSQGRLNPTNALNAALQWLGNGYRQIAPGVYRSLDGARQFRMTDGDLAGRHAPHLPHIHFEALNAVGEAVENNHVILGP